MHNSCLHVCANAVFLPLYMLHALRLDILAHPPTKRVKVSKEAVISCITQFMS